MTPKQAQLVGYRLGMQKQAATPATIGAGAVGIPAAIYVIYKAVQKERLKQKMKEELAGGSPAKELALEENLTGAPLLSTLGKSLFAGSAGGALGSMLGRKIGDLAGISSGKTALQSIVEKLKGIKLPGLGGEDSA